MTILLKRACISTDVHGVGWWGGGLTRISSYLHAKEMKLWFIFIS